MTHPRLRSQQRRLRFWFAVWMAVGVMLVGGHGTPAGAAGCKQCRAERRQCRAARRHEAKAELRACRGSGAEASCRASARARLQSAFATCNAARAVCTRCCQATGSMDACTHSTRQVGSCASNADCDDANVCTDDLCDPFLGCLHSDIPAACDDGNACTASDACNAGTCIGGDVAANCTSCQAVVTIPSQGGTYLGHTSGTGTLTASCSQTDTSGERVYSWTPQASGVATIQTCGSATLFDTVLSLRTGTCGAGTEVACNDDTVGCGTGEPNDHHGSKLTPTVTAGQTYLIVVDGFSGADGGFALTVFPPAVCGNGVQEGAEACDGAAAQGCPTGQCTPQCTCVPPAGGAPDLTGTISQVQVAFGSTVDPGDVIEGCVTQTTNVDLLRFSFTTTNIGTAEFLLGDPMCPNCATNPDVTCGNPQFICSPAGGHMHAPYQNYARYELLDGNGQAIASGHKQGYCLRDTTCPAGITPNFTCNYQGLTAGCGDLYFSGLGCQYVDVTNVPPGNYTLRATVDPFNRIAELDESNNVAEVPVVIPPREVPTGACATPTLVPAAGGMFPGTTSGPSTAAGTCGATDTAPEQVFKWTPATSGVATIETCGAGTHFDTVLYIHGGLCNDTEIACNDDTVGCGINGETTDPHRGSRLTPNVIAGDTYYIFVDGFNGLSGAFTLTIVPPAETSTTSTTATTLPGPSTTVTTTSTVATTTPSTSTVSITTTEPPPTTTSSTAAPTTSTSSSTTSSLPPTTLPPPTTTTTTLGPNHAPICTHAVAVPGRLWPPDHQLVDVDVGGIIDPDGDPLTLTVIEIRQDELPTVIGSGHTCPDADGIGTAQARVRAERSGPGDGRVYYIKVRATDPRDASCVATVRVCVPHDQGHGGRCGDEGPLFSSTGPCFGFGQGDKGDQGDQDDQGDNSQGDENHAKDKKPHEKAKKDHPKGGKVHAKGDQRGRNG